MFLRAKFRIFFKSILISCSKFIYGSLFICQMVVEWFYLIQKDTKKNFQ